MKNNQNLTLRAFFASTVDLIMTFILLTHHYFYYNFIYDLLLDWIERPNYANASLASEDNSWSLVTYLWIKLDLLILIILVLFTILVINRLSSGFWLRQSLGQKFFKIEVSANYHVPHFYNLLLLARLLLSFPIVLIFMAMTIYYFDLEVIELLCLVLLIWFLDLCFIFLGKGKQLRDYILGTQLKNQIINSGI